MRVVLQKVKKASVEVEELDYKRSIGKGFVVLVGISDEDGETEVEWMARKIAHLRVFEDDAGKMNLSLTDVGGSLLSISQFTLFADLRRGNRPSFMAAGEPSHAKIVWQSLNEQLSTEYGVQVESGVFGEHMQVSLVNDGPVTIIVDTATDMGAHK